MPPRLSMVEREQKVGMHLNLRNEESQVEGGGTRSEKKRWLKTLIGIDFAGNCHANMANMLIWC